MPVFPCRPAAVAAALVACLALAPAAHAQRNQGQKKLQDHEVREIQSLYAVFEHALTTGVGDGVHAFQVDPSKREGGVSRVEGAPEYRWYNDAIKSSDNAVYVPFQVLLPQAVVPAPDLAFVVWVVPRGTNSLEGAQVEEGRGTPAARFYWAEEGFGQLRAAAAPFTAMQQFVRVFQVQPGEWDVYIGFRPHSKQRPRGRETPVPAVLVKHALDLPDLTQGLTTSSVMVLNRMVEVTSPLTPEQQKERPWVMGQLELVPSLDRQFRQSDNFGMFFQIYNAKVDNGKPDVTVEYEFHHREPGGAEKYFNKTMPQQFRADTLPPTWDAAAGYQLQAGQEIPLSSFPPGEYRLHVKVTDNLASETITRDVNFVVAGS